MFARQMVAILDARLLGEIRDRLAADPSDEDLWEVVVSHAAERGPAAVQRELRDWLRTVPDSRKALEALAKTQEREGDVALALELATEEPVDPRDPGRRLRATQRRVELLARDGRVGEAERLARELANGSSEDAREGRVLLARLALRQNDPEAALHAIGPDVVGYEASGDRLYVGILLRLGRVQ